MIGRISRAFMALSQQASVAVGGQGQVAATAPAGTKRAGRASSIGFSQMDVVKKSNQKPDHRIEVARRRRETMRARILAATMKTCSANPKGIPTRGSRDRGAKSAAKQGIDITR
jgi:hypothetical protein